MAKTDKTETEMPYEKVVEKLTATVEKLEKGDLALEAQITAFEEGVKLVRRGQSLLDAAEKKVEKLLENDSVAPFEARGDDGP